VTENDTHRTAALEVYGRLLGAWNRRNADDFAELFGDSGSCVGFDGSPMNGRAEIGSSLCAIFEHHPTATYVAKMREVRALGPTVTLVRAVAGMIPPGKSVIDAEKNAIQSLLIVDSGQGAQIALFQNTPAAFDGRPELRDSLTKELSDVARAGLVVSAV
jgi:uncharacterized protein (TIGR02246 family)